MNNKQMAVMIYPDAHTAVRWSDVVTHLFERK